MIVGIILLAVAGTILTGGSQALDIHPSENDTLLPGLSLRPGQGDSDSVVRIRAKKNTDRPTRVSDNAQQTVALSPARGQTQESLPAFFVDKYRLVRDGENYYLHSDEGRILSVPSAWLTRTEKVEDPLDELIEKQKIELEEEYALVSSTNFDEAATAFPIGDGRLGLHFSSYEIQKEGSAGAAAGRDVFLVFDPQVKCLHPGGLLAGITKERARYMGQFFALAHRFFLGDIDDDGLMDIGVMREEIKPIGPHRDIPSKVEYEKDEMRWFVYTQGPRVSYGRRDHWKYDPALDGKRPATDMVKLPLIGIGKTPVAFVEELSGGKLQRSRTRLQRPGQPTMVLGYGDFGPQVFAHELLGMEWYQWNLTGSPDPEQIDPIQVVVYKDMELDQVKQLYPVVKELKQAYRYVSCREALEYLDKNIAYFNEEKEGAEDAYYESLISDFSQTKRRIIDTLIGIENKK
jgi:hypothetical protein